MQLQRMKDGVCALKWLMAQGEGFRASVATISEAIDISDRVIEGVFIDLVKAGVVKAFKGVKGGQELKAPLDRHTLLFILEVLNQGPFAPIPCADEDEPCAGCKAAGGCYFGAFREGHQLTKQILRTTTLNEPPRPFA